jgi:hypothetical protein
MADGTTKPIKDINLGDKVTATNPKTGKTDAKPVTKLHLNRDHDLTDVATSATTSTDSPSAKTTSGKALVAAGTMTTAVLATTQHHPFCDDTAQTWTDTASLTPGVSTLRTPDGETHTVAAVTSYIGTRNMYNLTVDHTHTYYVIAGTTPVLVHNCGGGVDANGNPCACAAASPTNWNTNSRPTWGHTFSEHGAGPQNTRSLTDRARGTGRDQGQWSDNDDAADFLKSQHDPNAGPRQVPLPTGMGTVIGPDGTTVPATHAQLVPGRNGPYRTAFSISLEE